MRLPNGYGSVTKVSGNRRKPWRARVTLGWTTTDDGKTKQIVKYIGYYASKKEALKAIAEYHENPYDIDNNITFAEIYEKWSKEAYLNMINDTAQGYKSAYKICTSLYDMSFKDIKQSHLQAVIDNSGKNYPTLRKLKVLLNQLYDYAMANDIVSKNYADYINITKFKDTSNKTTHTIFTANEIQTLWDNVERNEYLQIILMLIYSGVRISELLELKKGNINLEERWFDVVGSKTEAGIRKVPISKKTIKFFEYWYNKTSSEYLLTTPDGKPFGYRNYYDSYWKPFLKELNMEHRPHDTRHTCVSMLAMNEVSQTLIKMIVGHSGAMTLTEKVYTHIEISKLIEAIDKI